MDMRFFNRAFAICTAAALLAPAMYAQNPGGSAAEEENGLQRTADLVNLMRTVFDPNPSPVLVSPAERAVAGKTSAGSNAAVVKTVPVVIMPDIVIPESVADSGANADANTDADDPPCPAVTAARKKNTDGDDSESDDYPPYSYAFFFGDYVPYYRGWFYYSDRWIWGRRGAILFDPPGWIPPPPRRSIRSSRTSAPSPDRVRPSRETADPPRERRLAPCPPPHRKPSPRKSRTAQSPSCRISIASRAKKKRRSNRWSGTPRSRSRQACIASRGKTKRRSGRWSAPARGCSSTTMCCWSARRIS